MCSSGHTQNELEHIASAISQLERLHAVPSKKAARGVMTTRYWRNRIKALVEAAEMAPAVSAQASVLLDRLEELDRLSLDRN